jgi:hypothetical protein
MGRDIPASRSDAAASAGGPRLRRRAPRRSRDYFLPASWGTGEGPDTDSRPVRSPVLGDLLNSQLVEKRKQAVVLDQPAATYQVSMWGRRFPGCCHQGVAPRSKSMAIQRRVSAGSMTSSISPYSAMEIPLPRS